MNAILLFLVICAGICVFLAAWPLWVAIGIGYAFGTGWGVAAFIAFVLVCVAVER